MKVFHIHTYDRGDFHESIVGPSFKTKGEALRWVFKYHHKIECVAHWEIKEHTL